VGVVTMQAAIKVPGGKVQLEVAVKVAASHSPVVACLANSAVACRRLTTKSRAAVEVSLPDLQLPVCAVHHPSPDIADVVTFPVATGTSSDKFDLQARPCELALSRPQCKTLLFHAFCTGARSLTAPVQTLCLPASSSSHGCSAKRCCCTLMLSAVL
jgi:hypothetical protein